MAFPSTAVMTKSHASRLHSDIIVRLFVLLSPNIAITLTAYKLQVILEDIFHLSRIPSDTPGYAYSQQPS